MIIYKAVNKINGKVYVGQTVHSLEHRRSGHERDCRCKTRKTIAFHNALIKYGYENFEWEVLRECTSQKELDYYEDFYIKQYDSMNREKGYNLKSGGKLGVVFTDEVKAKIGESTKLKWQNEECASKMREGLRKGTETCKLRAQENFVDFECPYCHKIIKLKPWEARQRKYCSQECSQKARHEETLKNIQLATKVNIENYSKVREERLEKIKEWLKDNKQLVLNCKLNKLTFLNDLADFVGVKDTRTLGKVLNTSGKKDIIVKLKELIKMYADPADD